MGVPVNRLTQVSVREGATLYMVFLTGFFALLHRLSGQQDLVVGTPIANRNWLPIEGMIGTFVIRWCFARTFQERWIFLHADGGSSGHAGCIAHQDLPFEKLVEELHPDLATADYRWCRCCSDLRTLRLRDGFRVSVMVTV